MAEKIIIDPGHGGFDAGASYQNRNEKDDNLKLALAVGKLLEQDGYDVVYTRTADQYDSPFDKAQIANNAQGDLFVSFHRNSSEYPDQYTGVQTLVYGTDPLANRVAQNVNENLENLGFRNIGTEQRKELIVLKRTSMPAVLLEVGFINSDKDNQLFDEHFSEMADAIASGIRQALPSSYADTDPSPRVLASGQSSSDQFSTDFVAKQSGSAASMGGPNISQTFPWQDFPENSPAKPAPPSGTFHPSPGQKPVHDQKDSYYYYIQVGLFRQPQNAAYLMGQLRQQGYPVIWHRVSGLIAIWVGPQSTLDEAVQIQRQLQSAGYDTLLVTDRLIQ